MWPKPVDCVVQGVGLWWLAAINLSAYKVDHFAVFVSRNTATCSTYFTMAIVSLFIISRHRRINFQRASPNFNH